jgi:hypothetical protein
MPKVLPFEEIEENKKFEFETKVKKFSYDYRIQIPAKMGKKIDSKKLKVTIEVIEDE